MAVPQVVVIGAAAVVGRAAAMPAGSGCCWRCSCVLMPRLLRAPREQAPWYNATGTTLYVLGMLVAAFALRAAGRL